MTLTYLCFPSLSKHAEKKKNGINAWILMCHYTELRLYFTDRQMSSCGKTDITYWITIIGLMNVTFKFTRSVWQLRVHEKCVTQQSGQRPDRAEKHWCGDSARMSFSVFCPATHPSLLKSLKPFEVCNLTLPHTTSHETTFFFARTDQGSWFSHEKQISCCSCHDSTITAPSTALGATTPAELRWKYGARFLLSPVKADQSE